MISPRYRPSTTRPGASPATAVVSGIGSAVMASLYTARWRGPGSLPAMLSAGRDRRVDGSEEVAGVGALDGQVALVTGGASGIGLATARRLRAEGARVAVVDMAAPPDGAAEVVLRRDVAEATSWPEIVAAIEAELGGIDLAHLNAGVGQ